MSMNKKLSIVIPCKNEGSGIINVLKLLYLQKVDCTIYIADSSDDSKTRAMLRSYVQHSTQIIKVVDGGLPSVARNNGAKLVKTPYVLFMDADIFVSEKGLINDCLKIMESNDLDLLTVKIGTKDKYNVAYRIFEPFRRWTSKKTPFAIGGFMMFNVETFRRLGGFDETDVYAEDFRLSMKVNPKKFRVLNRKVLTSSRRFKNKGIFYMAKMTVLCWLNRNNPKFFKRDHKYWD